MASKSYTNAGTFTWVCPANVTAVQAECWGGGSGGWNNGCAPAGGGGAYAKTYVVAVTPGVGYTVVVGYGGYGHRISGAASYFKNTSTCLAAGGNYPASRTSYGYGGQASACVGDVKHSGGNGGYGKDDSTGTSAAGGGAGGPHGAGTAGENRNDSKDDASIEGGDGDAGFGGSGNDHDEAGESNPLGGGGGGGGNNNDYGGHGGWPGGGGGGGEQSNTLGACGQVIITYTLSTVTTQAVSSVGATSATGNGTITDIGSANATERGFVYGTTSYGNPGNLSPTAIASSYPGNVYDSGGSYGAAAFSKTLTGLISRTTYYVRAYALNTAGYTYGDQVSFTTIGFTNPGNIYSSNDTYATLAATSGDLAVSISKDGGATWQSPRVKTFGANDSLETYGNGSTELWGTSLTRADMVDANFRVKLSQGDISQVYKNFGFATGTELLTGLEIAVEAHYASSTIYIDLLEVKIYYGTSSLPVQAGSISYASDGRKNGEGAGNGTGVLVFYDGTAWRACDTGASVAA